MSYFFQFIEDAQENANSEQSDAILYIGGPPNPDRSCRNDQQFGHIIKDITTNNTELGLTREQSSIREADCDCRQWAFQFLRPKTKKLPPSDPDISHNTIEDTTTLPSSEFGKEELDYWGDNNVEDITDFIESSVRRKSTDL